jgi:DNA-binding CsgD family transcriptional regulator
MAPVGILFGLVAFPLFAIAWYFVLSFAAGILDEALSPSLRIAYILLWAVLFVIFLVRIQFALSPKSLPSPSQVLNRGSGLVAGAVPIAIYAYFLARSARRSRSEGRAWFVKFGAVSLAGYILLVAAVTIPQTGLPFRWAAPLLLGAALLSPVLVLRSLLSQCYRPVPPETLEGQKLGGLIEQCGLSTREGEILSLLLRGKSNKEIERALFISSYTVRNHIYNIYQKLGVGSRLQLMNFVRTRFEEPNPRGL